MLCALVCGLICLVAAFRSIHGVSLVAVSDWSHPFLLGPHPLTFLPHGILFVFIMGFVFLPRPFTSILGMIILVCSRLSFGVFSYLVWGILVSRLGCSRILFGVFLSLVWGILVSRLGYSRLLFGVLSSLVWGIRVYLSH